MASKLVLFNFNERCHKLAELGSGNTDNIDLSQFTQGIFTEDMKIVGDHRFFNEPIEIIPNKKLVLLKQEPEAVIHVKDWMKQHINLFHKVYTFDADLLHFFPEKTVKWLSPPGCTLEETYVSNIDTSKKEFKISSWISAQGIRGCWGHLLRADIMDFRQHFPQNCYFFRSALNKNPIYVNIPTFYETKSVFFDTFQYAICIENSRQINYFTEKIIDCLMTKTIPIYWGCPNISEFFDTTGWIFFESAAELIPKIQSLTPDYYSKHVEVIEKNYQEARKYCDFYSNLERQAMNK
jgi:hypothetical protein